MRGECALCHEDGRLIPLYSRQTVFPYHYRLWAALCVECYLRLSSLVRVKPPRTESSDEDE